MRKSKGEPESPGIGGWGRRVDVGTNCTALADLVTLRLEIIGPFKRTEEEKIPHGCALSLSISDKLLP